LLPTGCPYGTGLLIARMKNERGDVDLVHVSTGNGPQIARMKNDCGDVDLVHVLTGRDF
jgi:hypothetical protein